MTASSQIIVYELTSMSIPKNFDKASTTQVNSVSNQKAMAKTKFNYLPALTVTYLWDHAYLQSIRFFILLIRKPISDA